MEGAMVECGRETERMAGVRRESKDGLLHMGSVLQWRCMGMPPISQSSQQDSSVRKGASWVIWSPQNHVWGKERPKFPSHTWPYNNKHYIYMVKV